jgi:hypothetical protein
MADGISNSDKLKCIERELTYRKHVYPRLKSAGKMTDTFMTKQIAVMEAIRDDYIAKVREERLL